MSEPTHGHGHPAPEETPWPGFQPTGEHAVNAQQEQIARLRQEKAAAEDREVFFRACLAQYIAEANQRIAELAGEISALRGTVAQQAARLRDRDDDKTDGAFDEVEESLDNQVADGHLSDDEPPAEIKIDDPVLATPETATFLRGDGSFPEAQAGIPIDKDAAEYVFNGDPDDLPEKG